MRLRLDLIIFRRPTSVLIMAFIVLTGLIHSQKASCQITEPYTFFSQTQFPLEAIFIQGDQPGPTVMVQGGIQGDEPAGYLTAELLTRARVLSGNLIVVPRANLPAVLARTRSVNVDLNRRFDTDYHQFYEDTLARAIRFLVRQSDALIHLHEGSGFYNPEHIDSLRNPKRYGQSLIIDTAVFQNRIFLARTVQQVLPRLNAKIVPATYHFQLFNTKTHSETSQHPEQRKSLTYFALNEANIPAVAVEVSKDIANLKWKVRHQFRATQKLLQQFGVDIVFPDLSRMINQSLMEPQNTTCSVNSKPLNPRGTSTIELKSPLSFACTSSLESLFSPKLGLYASDGHGRNLLQAKTLMLHPSETLRLVADGKPFQTFNLDWSRADQPLYYSSEPVFVCSLNGKIRLIPAGDELEAVEGDRLVLLGIWNGEADEVLNLKGYVSQTGYNSGQDAGHEIVLYPEIFIQRYLLQSRHPGDWRCEVVRETKDKKRSRMTIRVLPRKVRGITLRSEKERSFVLPFEPGAQCSLQPGSYTLEQVLAKEGTSLICPVIQGRPRSWGDSFSINEGEDKTLQLFLATTFEPLGQMTFSGTKRY